MATEFNIDLLIPRESGSISPVVTLQVAGGPGVAPIVGLSQKLIVQGRFTHRLRHSADLSEPHALDV